MNGFRPVLCLCAGILMTATAGGADKPAAPAGSTIPPARFKQVRQRAAALFQSRNQPPTAPMPAENPLRTAGDVTAARPRGTASAAPVDTTPRELILLQKAMATLHVSGMFEKDGESYLVINSKPYRLGDLVQTAVDGEATYLRVREITRYSVTLALDDTEMTLKYGGTSSKKAAR